MLGALGQPPSQAAAAVRFSLGRGTTEAEVDEVAALMPPILERVRTLAPPA